MFAWSCFDIINRNMYSGHIKSGKSVIARNFVNACTLSNKKFVRTTRMLTPDCRNFALKCYSLHHSNIFDCGFFFLIIVLFSAEFLYLLYFRAVSRIRKLFYFPKTNTAERYNQTVITSLH